MRNSYFTDITEKTNAESQNENSCCDVKPHREQLRFTDWIDEDDLKENTKTFK